MRFHILFGLSVPLSLCTAVEAAAQSNPPQAASTVVLMTTDIQVAADGSDTKVQHVELRADNEAGAQQAGQISLIFEAASEELSVVEAHTLKRDGRTLPVDASAIYEQNLPGQSSLTVTGQRSKLVVFPQFAAGDTAVYTIRRVTRHPNFVGQFIYDEIYPRGVAFNEVRETITAPKSFPLYAESHDVDATKRDDGANVIYSWHYSAPNPIRDEPATFAPLEHTPRFFVSSFKDYAQMGRAYAALAEPKRLVTPKIKALAEEIVSGTADPRVRAQKIYEWVSAHVRYVAIALGSGSFVPRDVDVIIDTGYGDCKDHDLILQVLLQAVGIEARSILINANDHYMLPQVPTFVSLNHVITFVPQFNLYLDSSVGLAPFGTLPLQEYGKPMVVASRDAATLGKMPILPAGTAKVALKTVLALDDKGVVTGTTTTKASGPYAIALRTVGLQIQAAGPDVAGRLLKAMGNDDASGVFTIGAPAALTQDYTISATLRWQASADIVSGKNSFFMPPGIRLMGQSGDGVMGPFDPGTLQVDEPTVCYSAQQSEELSLKAPPGVQFNDVPRDVRVETPQLQFTAHWSLTGDTMTVRRDFTSRIDQALCTGAVRAQAAIALKQIADSYDVAISFVERAKGGDAKDDAWQRLYNSGLSHFNANELELALADFEKALLVKPDEPFALGQKGAALAQLGRNAEALQALDKSLQGRVGGPRTYGYRGSVHAKLGHSDLAIADFTKAIEVSGDDAEIRGNLLDQRGALYLRANRLDLALADFNREIQINPASYYAFENRGWIEKQRKQLGLAIADAEKAIALKPDYPGGYRLRGLVRESQRQYDAALQDFDKLLALEPDNLGYIGLRAETSMMADRYAPAIADYNRILAAQPDNITVLRARANAHLKAKEYQLAIADFDKVIAARPDNAEAFLFRGDAKNKLGRKAEGERDIAAALKLDPSLGK